jgi:hypothetical protein
MLENTQDPVVGTFFICAACLVIAIVLVWALCTDDKETDN